MDIIWSNGALRDLRRIHEFLAPRNPRAAAAIRAEVYKSARTLSAFPRRGLRQERWAVRDVRVIFSGAFVVRYEVGQDTVRILRVFHGRETR